MKHSQLILTSFAFQPKKILVFDRIENYYGTGGRIKCPFLPPSQEKRLRSKCILKEDTIFTPLAQYDVYVNVRNWKPVIWEHVIPLQHVYLIQESPYVAKYADFSINNAILSSYSTQSDIVLPYGYFRKFGNSAYKQFVALANNFANNCHFLQVTLQPQLQAGITRKERKN